jgi:lysozyme family protein
MKENWERSFELMLGSEDGFSDDPRDNGNKLPDGRPGSTMLGVTQYNWENWTGHQVTHEQMKKLKPEDVKPFYKKKFWDACRCNDLPEGIDYLVFDFAVNAGVGRSAKTLQSAVGATPDGSIGPLTLAAVAKQSETELIDNFSAAKVDFYVGLNNPTYEDGWLNRVKHVRTAALGMAESNQT